MDLEQSEIVEFYKDQTVFITGGTGFLGKLLIEKLLRVCDVRRIYILVRSKKGISTHERFKNLFDFPCFDRLKSERDGFLNKISLTEGDCTKSNLGLTPDDQKVLKNEVTCFIHAAANVKFDQSLRSAASNASAVRDALNLARQMPKLIAFVFVSTAYSNCIHPFIGERFYNPPMTADELFKFLEETSDEMVEKITPRLLGPYPNTYIFTKCIAENIIKEESENIPVAIVRPAIVISTIKEPMPGWIDNFYGVLGLSMMAFLGLLKTMHATLHGTCNIVPCDFVSNLTLALAWHVCKKDRRSEIPIFNYIGPKKYPLTWGGYRKLMEGFGEEYISIKAVMPYNFKFRENYYWNETCQFFQHTVLAYIADFFLIVTGNSPIAIKKCARGHELLKCISYFTYNFWFFDTRNIDNLWNGMNDADKRLFSFDCDNVDILKYADEATKGARVYLLKDPLETIPAAKKKMRKLIIANYAFLTILTFILIYFIIFIIRLIF